MFFNKKRLVVLLLVGLMAFAVYLNVGYREEGDILAEANGGSKVLGQAQLVDGDVDVQILPSEDADAVAQSNYFAAARLNRQTSRDEALDLLREVSENEQAASESREEAVATMAGIAGAVEAEGVIENLVMAKGFEDCVVHIHDGAVNLVVKSEGALMGNQVTQIMDIVIANADVTAGDIKIIEMNS